MRTMQTLREQTNSYARRTSNAFIEGLGEILTAPIQELPKLLFLSSALVLGSGCASPLVDEQIHPNAYSDADAEVHAVQDDPKTIEEVIEENTDPQPNEGEAHQLSEPEAPPAPSIEWPDAPRRLGHLVDDISNVEPDVEVPRFWKDGVQYEIYDFESFSKATFPAQSEMTRQIGPDRNRMARIGSEEMLNTIIDPYIQSYMEANNIASEQEIRPPEFLEIIARVVADRMDFKYPKDVDEESRIYDWMSVAQILEEERDGVCADFSWIVSALADHLQDRFNSPSLNAMILYYSNGTHPGAESGHAWNEVRYQFSENRVGLLVFDQTSNEFFGKVSSDPCDPHTAEDVLRVWNKRPMSWSIPDQRSLRFFLLNSLSEGSKLKPLHHYAFRNEIPKTTLSYHVMRHTHFQLRSPNPQELNQYLLPRIAEFQVKEDGSLNPECYQAWDRMLDTENIFLAELLAQDDILNLLHEDAELADYVRGILPKLEKQIQTYGERFDEARSDVQKLTLSTVFSSHLSYVYAALGDTQSQRRTIDHFIDYIERITPEVLDCENFAQFGEPVEALYKEICDEFIRNVEEVRKDAELDRLPDHVLWTNHLLFIPQLDEDLLGEHAAVREAVLALWESAKEDLRAKLETFYEETLLPSQETWTPLTQAFAQSMKEYLDGNREWFHSDAARYHSGVCRIRDWMMVPEPSSQEEIKQLFPSTEGESIDYLVSIHNDSGSPIVKRIIFERIFSRTQSYGETVALTGHDQPDEDVFKVIENYQNDLTERETAQLIVKGNELGENVPWYVRSMRTYGLDRVELAYKYPDTALRVCKNLVEYYAFRPIEEIEADAEHLNAFGRYIREGEYHSKRDSAPPGTPDTEVMEQVRDYITGRTSLLSEEKKEMLWKFFKPEEE